jgi:putative ABC transport system permease protein
MNLWQLAKRSIVFYWRTNLGVLLAVAVSTAVLTGAMLVGDSVRHTLHMMLIARLGETDLALVAGDRFFRSKLADELAARLNTQVAPVLQLPGLISNSDGTKRANKITVLGVDQEFYGIGTATNPFDANVHAVVISEQLAEKLDVKAGEEVVLRIAKPGLMPSEAPLTPDSGRTVGFRMPAAAIAGPQQFGHFNLQANQLPPLNAHVPIRWLQEAIGRSGRANTLLIATAESSNVTPEKAADALADTWQLADIALELRRLDSQQMFELRSSRVFIDESLSRAAIGAADSAVGILTYFVNEFRLGDTTTPYSVVSAIGQSEQYSDIVPHDMRDDEIVINNWLADDLGAQVGSSLELTYFVVGPGRDLQQAPSTFRVRKIVPVQGLAADPGLMPDFPGLADVDNCRDWQPGIPIDLGRIRPKDEQYWDTYRGTPKAFVTLKAGQEMWANRYGNLTAVRYPADEITRQELAAEIISRVSPDSVGLTFMPVRQQGARASSGATDFGRLFLGFSMFLIAAAILLTGLLFVFGVESRSEQLGMLLAVGLSPKLVRNMLLLEGVIIAAAGALAGTAAAVLYTRAMIFGLATAWQTAVAGATIYFHAAPATLVYGALIGLAVSTGAIFITSRRQLAKAVHTLLAGNIEWWFSTSHRPSRDYVNLAVAVFAAVGAVALAVFAEAAASTVAVSIFFGAGTLLLIAALAFDRAVLTAVRTRLTTPMASLTGLALRNATRRTGRSLAVIALFACGVFLIVAVGANRHNPLAHADQRDSGTGGFALYGESSITVLHDLGSQSEREVLGLDNDLVAAVQIVQFRVHEGDDASCFNLNRAQKPRLLAVQPDQLHRRGAFRFASTIEGISRSHGWLLLERGFSKNVIPAVGDYPTVVWALGKSVGDKIGYIDESSVLQGSLIVAEDAFIERFPSEPGYRVFLVDVPEDKVKAVADKISFQFRDFGMDFMPTAKRLAAFNRVESMYLSIFQLLGGLGLILGSIGLGVVVLRNVLERRSELAMLRAVGLDKPALKQVVIYEHAGLLLAGLVCGAIAALVAVVPALRTPAPEMPYVSLPLTILAIAASGLIWVWAAAAFALRGPLLDALRTE